MTRRRSTATSRPPARHRAPRRAASASLSRSRQDYLKALFALAPLGERVTTSRLAERLGVSAPSVTKMLGQLAAARLVTHAPRAGAPTNWASRP